MASKRGLSRAPTIVALAAIVLSILLCIPVVMRMSTDTVLPLAIAGYVLTPFVVAGALIVARQQDLKKSMIRGYPRAAARATLRQLTVLVALSFIPAVVHVWYIAGYVGAVLS